MRACRGVGFAAALDLIRIRSGAREKIYHLRVPQWPHPVFVRGGTSSDAIVLYEILATDEYGHIGDLGSPKFMIDAGANVGFASPSFLNRYPDTQIVAIEPDPQTIELCRKNLAPYSERVTILQGATLEPRRLDLFSATPGGIRYQCPRCPRRRKWLGGSVHYLVCNCRLRKGLPVDLLKIDVEGGEREIFDPGDLRWLSRVKNIVIELHGPDCEDRFFSAIKPFKCEKSRRDQVWFCANLRAPVNAD